MSALVCTLLVFFAGPTARGDDWPQWGGPQRDGVWRETGILRTFPPDGLQFRWRVPIGAGFAGPAVAKSRVYVNDRLKEKNTERLLCLDERTGKIVWTHEYSARYQQLNRNSGPRATPTVHEGKVYSLGAMGHLFCLDANTGKVIWQKNFVTDYKANLPIWGAVAAPLIDGQKLICIVGGADDAVVVAFNKDTGKEIWRALTADEPGYCPPTIIEAGGRRQLIIWHPWAVVSLNPRTGKVFWEQPFRVRSGLCIAMPRLEKDLLFVSAFYNGPLMMRLGADQPTAELLWKGRSSSEKQTDGIHCLMSTPWLKNGYIYGIGSYGHLRCLDAKTGQRRWETLELTGQGRWWNAFLVPNGDRFFVPNEQGELIIARIGPDGHKVVSRTKLIAPTGVESRRDIVWSHPAFANRHIFARNDKEIVRASLAAPDTASAAP